MKILNLFLLPLLLCLNYNSFSQIILSHSSLSSEINQFYVEDSTYLDKVTHTNMTPDYGTKVYSAAIGLTDYDKYYIFIVRKQNKWQIERFKGPYQLDILFRQKNTSNLKFLNCLENYKWEHWSGSIYHNSIYYTGKDDTTLRIAGDCHDLTSETTSSEILPNQINLPNLSSDEINEIPNPKLGTLIYDKNNKALKLYNESGWNTIELNPEIEFIPSIQYENLTRSQLIHAGHGNARAPQPYLVKSEQYGSHIYAKIGETINSNGVVLLKTKDGEIFIPSDKLVRINKDFEGEILPSNITFGDISTFYDNHMYTITKVLISPGHTENYLSSYELNTFNDLFHKPINTLSNEKIEGISVNYNSIYIWGNFLNNGIENSFIKKINKNTGEIETTTRFISNNKNKISSLLIYNSILYVLGISDGNYTIVGPTNISNQNNSADKRLFINSLNEISLNPNNNYNTTLSNKYNSTNFTLSNFGITYLTKNGITNQSLRFTINSENIVSEINNKTVYNGSFIVSMSLNTPKILTNIEGFSYVKIEKILGNHILFSSTNSVMILNDGKYYNTATDSKHIGLINSKNKISKFSTIGYNNLYDQQIVNNIHYLDSKLYILGCKKFNNLSSIVWGSKINTN